MHQLLLNVFFTSILLSLIIIIIINNILIEYSITSKDKVKSFIYIFISVLTTIILYRQNIIEKYILSQGEQKDINDLFNELEQGKQYNQLMSIPVNPEM